MAPATAHIPLPAITAAARVAALADALEARAQALAPLLDLHRAHLRNVAPGLMRSGPEHLLELLDLGLLRRSQFPAPRRARSAEPGVEDLVRLASRLAAEGCPEPALSRVKAWRDFAVAVDVREVLAVAEGLCAWLDRSAGLLGPYLSAPGDAMELLRAEILCRALRRRPQVFGRDGAGLTAPAAARRPAAFGAAAPAPTADPAARRGPGRADPRPAAASWTARSGW